MAKTTDFTNFATERPNYFPGQYLLEDDFELQHKYFSDRQCYHNQSLHISGIIEGLEVEVIQDEKVVQIKSGSAINNHGELIILKEDILFSEFNNITTGELYIQYSEEKQVKQQKDIADSYTRWKENPKVEFADTTPDNCVKLAKLTISEDTIIPDPNVNVREYSGLSLPNSNSKALTLRSGGNTKLNLAVLTGSLKIDDDLIVDGTGKSTFAGSLTVSKNLTVDGSIQGNNTRPLQEQMVHRIILWGSAGDAPIEFRDSEWAKISEFNFSGIEMPPSQSQANRRYRIYIIYYDAVHMYRAIEVKVLFNEIEVIFTALANKISLNRALLSGWQELPPDILNKPFSMNAEIRGVDSSTATLGNDSLKYLELQVWDFFHS